jgi:hypothetical protein
METASGEGGAPEFLRRPPASADARGVPVLRIRDESGGLRWQVPAALWSHPREDLGGFRYPVGASPDRPLTVKGPLTFVGYGLTWEGWDDYRGERIEDRIAVMFTGTPGGDHAEASEFEAWSDLIREKVGNAKAHGAVGVWLERSPLAAPDAGRVFFRPSREVSPWGGVVKEQLPLPVFGAGSDALGVIVGLSSDLFAGHRTPGEGALTGLLKEAESRKGGLGPIPLALVGELVWNGGLLQKREGARCVVWYQPDSPAARDIEAVGRECESTLREVESLLGARMEGRVTVLLSRDWRSKMYCTRTLGWGTAGNGRMGMVYDGTEGDRETLLHELCHVVAGAAGGSSPPACFNEGLAELVGKTRGDLQSVQAGRVVVDDVTAANLSEGELWTLQELLQLSDIGPDETNPAVAYPEAASFCAFLMRRIGFDGFRELAGTLKAGDLPQVSEELRKAMGCDLTQLEAEWHAYLRGAHG